MAEQAQPTEQQAADMAQMGELMEQAKGLVSLEPYEISDDLRPKIDELGLWDNLAELRDQGYTVVEDVAPPELFDELREVIHRFAQETEGPIKGRGASMMLGRHPVVDTFATLPKILAIAEASVGQGMRASQFVSSIMEKGGPGVHNLHADQNWLPAPFPEHNCVTTFCIPCEGMTADGGATRVVPGSHKLRRHITPEEAENSETVPIEVEKGSVAVWDGSVWHSGGVRTIDGTRTVLHATYQRLYTQPIDDYTYLLQDEAYVEHASKEMLGLLGADLFYGTATAASGGTNMIKFLKSSIMSKK
jgi:ectoine hydroxylase-related dioxygenase (phytanoyl-CoA dioxygenase family)